MIRFESTSNPTWMSELKISFLLEFYYGFYICNITFPLSSRKKNYALTKELLVSLVVHRVG